jgi:hypothetical protein
MSDVEKAATTLRLARTKLALALTFVNTADSCLDEAVTAVGAAVQSSSNTEVTALPGVYTELRTGVGHVIGLLNQIDDTIAGYLQKLGAPADPPSPPTPAQAPTPLPRSPAQDDEPAQVAALRSELPPPVQPGTGQKTRGRWLGAGTSGEAVAVISGNDGQAEEAARYLKEIGITRPLAIVAHVETKANR